jgi:outer membrane lipoprotein-sorting protein
MVPDNLRTAAVAVLLGALVALSGIGTGAATVADGSTDAVQPTETPTDAADDDATDGPDDETDDSTPPSGDEVVETFRERVGSLETVVMTVETNVTVDGNRTMTTEQRTWVDYENGRLRSETETDRTETITVRNESWTVTYDVKNEQVNRFENGGGTGPRTTVDRMLNSSDVSYEGRERLDGEATYRLNVEPTNTGSMSGSVDATVWIDTETYFPEAVHIETDSENFGYEMDAQFRNVTLNASIPDDRFSIDIPEDAEEPDYSTPDRTRYDSLSALRDGTNRSVPDPDVPDAFDFEEGSVIEGDDYHSITLQYADGEDTLHVSKRPAIDYDYGESDRYETVTVGDHTGYYTEFEYNETTTSVLVLPCGDSTYSLFGDLSKEESVDVAESLACE